MSPITGLYCCLRILHGSRMTMFPPVLNWQNPLTTRLMISTNTFAVSSEICKQPQRSLPVLSRCVTGLMSSSRYCSCCPSAALYAVALATYLRSRSWMYCTLAKYIGASTRQAAMPGKTCKHTDVCVPWQNSAPTSDGK